MTEPHDNSPRVGLVIVSHSRLLAEGVAELAREMGGPGVQIATAGGMDGPGSVLGTDALRVMKAIESLYSEAGVLVLMDLGSAVMSAELALDLLPPDHRENVLLCSAPLVEGAVVAAVQARFGTPLRQVAAEACGALMAKQGQLGGAEALQTPPSAGIRGSPEMTLRFVVLNHQGLHARPAARLMQAMSRFSAGLRLRNLTTQSQEVDARSINAVMTLGVQQGHEVEFIANGEDGGAALEALRLLAESHFGDAPGGAGAGMPLQGRTPLHEAPRSGWLTGTLISPGIAIGPASVLWQEDETALEEDDVGLPSQEWDRLQQALQRVRTEVLETRAALALRADHQTAEIFDAHLLVLEDAELLRWVYEHIHQGAGGAFSVWKDAVERVARRYESLPDEYLRSRIADIQDVGRQVLLALRGDARAAPVEQRAGILAALDFAPSEIARLDAKRVQGLCAARGAASSHAAILARSLGIPAVFGLGEELQQIREGETLLVDATAARVCLLPDEALLAEYEDRARVELKTRQLAHQLRAKAALTRDGHRVEVAANIGQVAEARAAVEAGAEGVGLFRTEFLFFQRASAPDEDEQYEAYREAARALEGRPLIIRTLDVGGDKPLPYLDAGQEANPFLGVRGLRFCLVNRELFSAQLRAIARAAVDAPIRVMFPMVATREEWLEARALWEEAAQSFPAARHVEVGLMIEIPSAVLLVQHLAAEASFFSLGTNDLTQYLFAAERGNERLAHLSDALHPALLQMVARVTEEAHARGRWVGLCGELAGDALAVPLLVGLGVDELSMSVPAIASVKQALRACHAGEARVLARQALSCGSAAEVRRLLAGEAFGEILPGMRH
ncbi:phosphoenolpyruvate--protein phosphotransferase [Stigmatella sp. ncwal1]|uniref:Phosphoenolpyruvate--protein phosphotransferase n=1 Tax=Stigmatella ashevillensis TaxID=2995309 RepID=A0ABT5DJN3_9BACT|nr:phosphoenolpyruvate--protein phosphotransferase [Stigmatella ashevillena]MDC0713862.1 phosphoenolpyruvate--protein phosphotransferase [Stigmatella ashevillena]